MTMAWAFFTVLLLMLPCGLQAFHGKRFFRPRLRCVHAGCRTDVQCPTDSCCQITYVNRWGRYLGKCVPRDPDTMMCTRPKQCKADENCGAGSCCRFARRTGIPGECDKFGQEGDECTEVTYGRYPRLCPCAEGFVCDVPPSSGTGQCRAPTTRAPTTTTTENNNPCGCPNLEQFCCTADGCATRPDEGDGCSDPGPCPCVSPFVCNDQGICAMPESS